MYRLAAALASQGKDTNNFNSHFCRYAGGGGGAGSLGGDYSYVFYIDANGVEQVNPTLSHAGDGGDGVMCDFSGVATWYGGGGGGGDSGRGRQSLGGNGGGGKGGSGFGGSTASKFTPGENASPNTGGGGGGGSGYSWGGWSGGDGGSGIVIVRYRLFPNGLILTVE